MKKFILGLLVGAVLFVPATAVAELAGGSWTNHFKDAAGDDNAISVFDDADNKCYIVKGKSQTGPGNERSVAMSCVKR